MGFRAATEGATRIKVDSVTHWRPHGTLSRKAAAFKSRGGGKAVMEVLTKSKKIFLQREGEPQTKCCSGTQVRTHARTRLLAPPAA